MLCNRLERLSTPVAKHVHIGSKAVSFYNSPGTRRVNQDGLTVIELRSEHFVGLVADGHGTGGELMVTAFIDEIESRLMSYSDHHSPDCLRQVILDAAKATGSRETFKAVLVDNSCGGGSTPGLVFSGFEFQDGRVRFFHAGDASGVLLSLMNLGTDRSIELFRTLPHVLISDETGEPIEGLPGRRIDCETCESFDVEMSPFFDWDLNHVLLIHSDGLSYRGEGELLSWLGKRPDSNAIVHNISTRLASRQKSGWGFDNVSVVVVTNQT